MECTKCGAELEEDSRFCIRCAAPVAGASEAPLDRDHPSDDDDEDDEDDEDEAHEEDDDGDADEEARDHDDRDRDVERVASEPRPSSASALGGRIVGILLALAVIVLGIVKLTNRPSVQIVPIEGADMGYGSEVDPYVEIPDDDPAERTLTESERALAGTWVARTGFDAPHPASTGSMLVQIQAIRAGLTNGAERCIWLELYDNLRGFQHECGVANGEPSVLQRTDPATGRSRPLGVGFRWSFDGAGLSITYDEPMIVSAGGRMTRFERTVLALPRGVAPFDVQQSFPEHPDIAPLTQRFDVFPGRYLGDGEP